MNEQLDNNEVQSQTPPNDLRLLSDYIKNQLNTGRTRESVFEEVLHIHGEKYERVFARKIGAMASDATIAKHKTLQYLLLGLLSLAIFTVAFLCYSYLDAVPNRMGFLTLCGITLFFMSTMLVNVWKFRGDALYSVMLFMAVGVLALGREVMAGHFTTYTLIYLGVFAATFAVAFILRKQAFPALRYGGPRKGRDGKYIMD